MKNRWQRIEEIFHSALDLSSDRRERYVEEMCGSDRDMMAEVLSLLAAIESEPEFLEQPAARIAADESSDPMIGRAVGAWRIVELIGYGGVGRVYRAERADGEYTMTAAVKVVKRGMDSEEIIRRFRSERQILASLDHPNIARLLEGGMTDDGRPFVVMEYVSGAASLDDYCDQRRLDLNGRLDLFAAVADAVQYAHRNLVVHRDLKMSNILVSGDGHLKLLDFGIAKILSPDVSPADMTMTATALRMMTPEYASPEQVRGEPITTATDIYSLGVLLYELLTGHRPYHLKSRSAIDIERIICNEEPTRPSTIVMRSEPIASSSGTRTLTPEEIAEARSIGPAQLRRRLSGDLDNIVLKAMHKDPTRRYATVAQMMEDIARHREGLPVEACGDSMGYRVGKFIGRHRLGVSAASVVFMSMAGFGAVMAVQRSRIARQAEEIALARDRAERVVEFLISIFQVADPWLSGGESVTARELLDRGAERIEAELAGQPALQSELLHTIAEVYNSLGLNDPAERMQGKCLQLCRRMYGNHHPATAAALSSHAGILRLRGEVEAARRGYEEALVVQQDLLGEENAATATTRNDFGILLMHVGDLDHAEEMFRTALDVRRRLYGEDHSDTARSLNNLAEVFKRRGNYSDAERMLRQVIEIQERILLPDDPDRARAMNNLAVALRAQEKYAEAERYDHQALELRRRVLKEHPDTAQSLNNLGVAHYRRDDYPAAAELFVEALGIWKKIYGSQHPEVARTLSNLAQVERGRSREDTAESLLREALQIHRHTYGDEHPEVAMLLHNLAEILRERGDFIGAEELYSQALQQRLKMLGSEHWQTAASLLGLGQVLCALGRFDEAEEHLSQSLEVLTARGHRLATQAADALANVRAVRSSS